MAPRSNALLRGAAVEQSRAARGLQLVLIAAAPALRGVRRPTDARHVAYAAFPETIRVLRRLRLSQSN